MTRRRAVQAGLLAVLVASMATAACGKKGPPLPPLVLLPTQPREFMAVRRGARVDLAFRIPSANVDRSTPASLERVDVYAWTVPGPVSAEDVLRRGTRIGSIPVNKPKDPDAPEPKTPAPKGSGLDQDEVATFTDAVPADAGADAYRAYVTVGINMRGRPGELSSRLAVPLVASPPAPAEPDVTFDEKAITVSWAPIPPTGDTPPYAYNVYRPAPGASLVTVTPVADPLLFVDATIEWDKERCYEVRTVATVENVRIESEASAARCVTPHDTFAPARPEGLVGVGSEGSISLIWTANAESDLAGYLVLRAVAPEAALTLVTPSPIADTNFRDTVPAGSRVTYAVQAVDKTGNRSEASNSIIESAR